MYRIYQGIGFNSVIEVDEASMRKISAETDVFAYLRNPATHNVAAVDVIVVHESVNTDTMIVSPTQVSLQILSSVTVAMPVGAYDLEIYKTDKSEMLYCKPDFALCLPSSASEAVTETDIETQTDPVPPETPNVVTDQDVIDYINQKQSDEPLN